MQRIEVNVSTGKQKVIDLTKAEVDTRNARAAIEAAKNTPQKVAEREVAASSNLEGGLDIENRLRVLEGLTMLTMDEYQDILVTRILQKGSK